MGVKGLLPCLQSITRSVSLEKYRGLTVAVDAMSWLHKGVFACDVRTLARSQRGESIKCESVEQKCVNYAIRKAETLKAKFGLEVILVIDGDSLPSKKEENEQRREERNNAFEKAVFAEKGGDSRAARRFYAQSCSVSHKIRYELIKSCKQSGISFLVAPYEADAQMARLAHAGMVDLVITEDSDILVYGCPRALFKVDFDTDQGQEIQLMRDLGENDSPSFRNWTHDMFVFMCIISGCDYCKGVPGIGIKLAHKIVRVHRTPSKIFSVLRAAGRMPNDFEDKFWLAFRTFRHQRVYCPSKQRIEPLWPIAGSNNDISQWSFLGEIIEPDVAIMIANGTLHPSAKIAWDEALSTHNQHKNRSTLPNKNDNCISRSGVQNENENAPPSYNVTTDADSNMFRFFSKSKKRSTQDSAVAVDGTRPPLEEVYLVGDETNSNAKQMQKGNYRDVPVHFHEYSTRLVGRSFQPLSRKRTKREDTGTKSSKCVQRIWEEAVNSQPQVSPVIDSKDQIKEKDGCISFLAPRPQDFAPTTSTDFLKRIDAPRTSNHNQNHDSRSSCSTKKYSNENSFSSFDFEKADVPTESYCGSYEEEINIICVGPHSQNYCEEDTSLHYESNVEYACDSGETPYDAFQVFQSHDRATDAFNYAYDTYSHQLMYHEESSHSGIGDIAPFSNVNYVENDFFASTDGEMMQKEQTHRQYLQYHGDVNDDGLGNDAPFGYSDGVEHVFPACTDGETLDTELPFCDDGKPESVFEKELLTTFHLLQQM